MVKIRIFWGKKAKKALDFVQKEGFSEEQREAPLVSRRKCHFGVKMGHFGHLLVRSSKAVFRRLN